MSNESSESYFIGMLLSEPEKYFAELDSFPKRDWFQDRADFPHYDVTKPKRRAAVEAGAVEIDVKGLVDLRKKARDGCKQGTEAT